MQFAGRFFLDVGGQYDPIRRRAFGLLDLEFLLEEAEALDAILAALELDGAERVALVDAEFAADDLVSSDGVAVNIDALDIHARRLAHFEGDVHFTLLGITAI